MNHPSQTILVLLLAPFLCSSAWARGMDDFETAHILSYGGGIASPSMTSALVENPAGLVYNSQFKLLAEPATENSNFSPMEYGGHFYFGNGSVGGGLGIRDFSNGVPPIAGSAMLADFGLAATANSINMTFGVAGSYLVQNSGAVSPFGATNFGLNAGMIYNPEGNLRFGATLFGLTDGLDAIGLGIAADLNSWATFVTDAAFGTKGSSGLTVKPALGIHLLDIQLTAGYGFTSNGGDLFTSGTTVGLGVRLNNTFQIEGYYNELALYYAALMIRI